MKILTQPNEKRCAFMIETHILPLKPACPYSGNPKAGSLVTIAYRPESLIIEVASLREYVDSYTGGLGDIRSMEGMIQSITQDCADATKAQCTVIADLIIDPGQEMQLQCIAIPRTEQEILRAAIL